MERFQLNVSMDGRLLRKTKADAAMSGVTMESYVSLALAHWQKQPAEYRESRYLKAGRKLMGRKIKLT